MKTERKMLKMIKDPVCGMVVNPARAVATTEYKEKTYYFCSNYCADLFDPEMTEPELTRLRTAIGGTGYRTHLAPAWWVKDRTSEAINKLIGLLFRR
jgi:YHS domain-containing protein